MSDFKIEQTFKQGLASQKAGDIQAARRLYAAILNAHPKHPDANHNMGLLCLAVNKVEASLPYFKTALEANFSSAQFWYSYIDALAKAGRFENAKQLLVQAKAKGAQGKPFQTLKKSIGTLEAEYKFKTGRCKKLFEDGDFNKVAMISGSLINIYPNLFEPYILCASGHQALGNNDLALENYKKALELNPDYAEAYNSMGTVLQSQGDYDSAIDSYERAIKIKPDYLEAYNGLGTALFDKQDFRGALCKYDEILKFKQDNQALHINKGSALRALGNCNEALESYKQAIKLDPSNALVYNNEGLTFNDLGSHLLAIDSFKKALKIKPDFSLANFNLGSTFLTLQNFEEGFRLLEYRWDLIQDNKQNIGTYLVTSKPSWDGESGQSVFVWAEQGVGDEIMFSSLIPELYDTCSQLIVQCDARLIPLFQRSFPKDIIYKSKRGDVSEDLYDFHIPIGSLAYKFRPSLESFGRTSGGYLVHDADKASMLRERLLESGAKILIGISWNTASPLVNASDRNIALPELARALNSSEVQLVCLQYGDVSNEIASLKKEFGIDVLQVSEIDNRDDIDGLASLIMACDRVVSTTNATVHLAGSLGAKVDVLLPISARWIWGTKGSQSTWYNTVTPHWQEVAGDWKDSLKSVLESVM